MRICSDCSRSLDEGDVRCSCGAVPRTRGETRTTTRAKPRVAAAAGLALAITAAVFVATASLVETSLGRGGKESVLVGMLLLTFVPVLVASTVGLTLSVVASRRAPEDPLAAAGLVGNILGLLYVGGLLVAALH